MKYIKTYEIFEYGPKVGDYILIDMNWPSGNLVGSEEFNYFVNTHVGKVSSISYDGTHIKSLKVRYDNQPEEFIKNKKSDNLLYWFNYRTVKGKIYYYYTFEHFYKIKLFSKKLIPQFEEEIELYKAKIEAEKYNI